MGVVLIAVEAMHVLGREYLGNTFYSIFFVNLSHSLKKKKTVYLKKRFLNTCPRFTESEFFAVGVLVSIIFKVLCDSDDSPGLQMTGQIAIEAEYNQLEIMKGSSKSCTRKLGHYEE